MNKQKQFEILVVDDEQDFVDPIAFWLEAKNYSVRIASNGQEAIKQIEKKIPSIVLLDINMPVMNGEETLKYIREHYGDLPVIMITAEIERLPSLQELGISGFFPKEGTLEQLEQLLEPIIRMYAKINPPKE
jgi:CheY-like chemotaxis protein